MENTQLHRVSHTMVSQVLQGDEDSAREFSVSMRSDMYIVTD